MAAPKVSINLPDLLKAYGGSSVLVNPRHDDARRASSAWLRGYKVLSEEKQVLHELDNSELLASLAYPYSSFEQLCLVCDLFNILYVLDTVTDDQDPDTARATCNVLLAAFKDLSLDSGSKLSKLTVDFATRYCASATPASTSRFITHTAAYLDSVVSQAGFRKNGEVLDIESFIPHRRDNSATLLCFDLIELALGINLPCEVYASPKFLEVYFAAVDMVWLSNDTCSYSMEKSIGHSGYNVVTVYMKQFDLDIQAAFDRAGREFDEMWTRFDTSRLELPTFGEAIDCDVQRFIDALKTWVVGMLHWNFETPRYFGDKRQLIKATHIVVL
ncbi:Isoprenoid synthase domain superfamily protein [Pleurotus pulmonarius]